MLEEVFKELLTHHAVVSLMQEKFWKEIQKHYSQSNRHYHNLNHLQNMLSELEAVRHLIQDWDITLFALFYHDIIYKATSKKNEEESAELAKMRLQEIKYPTQKIEQCIRMIGATKHHTITGDTDTDLFTDADLSILGAAPASYQRYAAQVRKEYSIYPDFLYNPGRKKVLQHFLDMPAIFKTKAFQQKYETTARQNIVRELAAL
jgi:predicted metal-dependent HD superfamily phosphohydrolase